MTKGKNESLVLTDEAKARIIAAIEGGWNVGDDLSLDFIQGINQGWRLTGIPLRIVDAGHKDIYRTGIFGRQVFDHRIHRYKVERTHVPDDANPRWKEAPPAGIADTSQDDAVHWTPLVVAPGLPRQAVEEARQAVEEALRAEASDDPINEAARDEYDRQGGQ